MILDRFLFAKKERFLVKKNVLGDIERICQLHDDDE